MGFSVIFGPSLLKKVQHDLHIATLYQLIVVVCDWLGVLVSQRYRSPSKCIMLGNKMVNAV